MTLFACGCETDGSARCSTHEPWACHAYPADFRHLAIDECPPCRLSRLRSVSLSPKATPTRGKR
jgi:hypothetical protein